jgi:GTP-binding protein
LYFRARFSTGAYSLSQLPKDSVSEVAFAGRSNCGKSSAINTITRNSRLARTSKTPGRTQQINYYRLGDQRYLVDLPGYGYAKVSQKLRDHWRHTLQNYFRSRSALRGLLLIMDIRQPLTELDWLMVEACDQARIPFHCLLTKADKLSKGAGKQAQADASRELDSQGLQVTLQLFSATKALGVERVHQMLDGWLGLSPDVL